MSENELWYEFKKWGDMREVFIARNRNGRRYGFVRFKGVGDVRRLERQLDNLILGMLKLHVNIPKHGRVRMLRGETNRNVKYRIEVTLDKSCDGGKHQGNLEGVREQQPQRRQMTTSYARAVMSGNKIIGRRSNLMRVTPVGTSSYSLMHLNIPTEKWTWLNNSGSED